MFTKVTVKHDDAVKVSFILAEDFARSLTCLSEGAFLNQCVVSVIIAKLQLKT